MPFSKISIRALVCLFHILVLRSVHYCKAENVEYSKSFVFNNNMNFRCEPVVCNSEKTFHQSYFHIVAGLEHRNGFPMLIYRVCEALQLCIKPSNILISLNYDMRLHSSPPPAYIRAVTFFNTLAIPVEKWLGNFTANNKMMQYLQTFSNISDHSRYIYHTDLDEITEKADLQQAMKELAANECDAVKGVWTERVSKEGHLSDINLRSGLSIEDQFPYKCKISQQFVPEWTIGKVIAYRADLRVVSGNHKLYCRDHEDDVSPWSWETNCSESITTRYDKSSKFEDIYVLLPKFKNRPKFCKTVVQINHFKFIGGLFDYLKTRMLDYRRLGLAYWKQSRDLIFDIKSHGDRICVECSIYNCTSK